MTDHASLPATGREWQLLSRPVGWPKPEDFAFVEAEVGRPGEGQVLVRNRYLSVDPYMRGRMSAAKSYVAPFELGKAMQGGAVGEVLASDAEGIAVGDHVLHFFGWREYAVTDAKHVVKVDPEAAPLSAYLGVLGMTGLTAYAGLLRTASFKEGDAVFVSGAAGAVGSQVGQIAKLKGASRVIGSAGTDEKVKLLTEEYGFDAAFNYKSAPVAEQLRAAAPDGIDVYFDNVGGDHLEAALGRLNRDGRIAVCGMISVYNNTEPAPGPRNLSRLIQTRGRIEGFLVGDHYDLQPQFVEEVGAWIREGRLKYRETVVEGVENTLDAFLGVLQGANTGKMIVKL
ncbi:MULTISPECIES: NADP-dependent oxidoreductase [Streptomyces]|jgi:NADPH-dependent curcumin reductase CurA|uniref:Oxidoreductase n=3 Tax=Streptomyces griseoaurantiacus TaxID=68213 RepID=F3NAW7_9ACTN|nr:MULTISPECIES: NADP-dependent oxidoreductase [Streptomyces]EGG49426.1 oxidoreductase [Streptomyces griseoaurantiacus M045]MBA5222652.1 NADP-dependent oxidoreductase [Streptomyces griseoaurantiacus]MCF0086340.1 putative NADP-dependent oxidoreductase YfmJ [Streptomyces sp. MH192]MCF0100088.1 putative NADP-dependent oxidoreductase YfmJ [Streptomyces sp. MH191]MDX3091967.1 NADP-dependent oxidoreductase [Streptomyces sp. ME12-02E]